MNQKIKMEISKRFYNKLCRKNKNTNTDDKTQLYEQQENKVKYLIRTSVTNYEMKIANKIRYQPNRTKKTMVQHKKAKGRMPPEKINKVI